MISTILNRRAARSAGPRVPQRALVFDPARELLDTWKTSNRVTVFLIEGIPKKLWPQKVPGTPRRTVQNLAAHIHNSRCMWIKMVGKNILKTPPRVDRRSVTQKQLVKALDRSSIALLKIFSASLDNNGKLPTVPPWMNVQPEVIHFMAYLIAHEGHHRGQLTMIAHQLGHRLPAEVRYGLWQWIKRGKEAR